MGQTFEAKRGLFIKQNGLQKVGKALERLDLTSELVKHCLNQGRKGLGKVRSYLKAYQTLSQPGLKRPWKGLGPVQQELA
jgi:hypothetical protein